tara:strand:- start:2810 stop:3682 length:873 start_codon:yes stop_codon:yes gene_type:complete
MEFKTWLESTDEGKHDLYMLVRNLLENIDIRRFGTVSRSRSIFRQLQKRTEDLNDMDKHDAGDLLKKTIGGAALDSQQASLAVSLQMLVAACLMDMRLRQIFKGHLKAIINFIPEAKEKKDGQWHAQDLDEYYRFLNDVLGTSTAGFDQTTAALRTHAPSMVHGFMRKMPDKASGEFWSRVHDHRPETDHQGMSKQKLKMILLRTYNTLGAINKDKATDLLKLQMGLIALTVRPVMLTKLHGMLKSLYNFVDKELQDSQKSQQGTFDRMAIGEPLGQSQPELAASELESN